MLSSITSFFSRLLDRLDAMHRLLMLIVIALLATGARAEPSLQKRRYEVQEGDAATALRYFAEQSGEQVLFLVPGMRGVRTRAIKGVFTAREAINQMLVGTVLVVVEDPKSGAFMIQRSPQTSRDPASPEGGQSKQQPKENTLSIMTKMNPIRILVAAVSMFFAPIHAQAEAATPGNQASTYREAGVIVGTVINQSTQKYLELASVSIKGTKTKVLTDKDGKFRLSGLEPGTYTLVATYTDLEPTTTTVTVTEKEGGRVDFELTSEELYMLGVFTVTSTLEGNSFAVNKQRQSESARTVTSIDAFVDQTTGNPGEFLKNLEGVQMNYSQNEPQTISLRGFDANLTTLTMDGNPIASAASTSTNRAVQVDQLSIGSIDSVEVFKAPIPSMSANSIGGAVNFVTKSAFDIRGRRVSLQVGVNTDSHDFMNLRKTPSAGHGDPAERRVYPIGRFSYQNTFLKNRLGVMFTVARDHTNQLGSSVSHAVNVTAKAGSTLPAVPEMYTTDNAVIRRGTLSYAPNRQLRTRDDAALNLDFKVNEDLAVFLRTSLMNYHSTNRNHGFTLTPSALTADSTLETYTTTNGTPSQSVSVFDKYTKSWQVSPGLKYVAGDWRIDLVGGYSKSINRYDNGQDFGGLAIRTPAASWRASTPLHTEVPDLVEQIGATPATDMYVLNNYYPNQGDLRASTNVDLASHGGIVTSNFRHTSDTQYSARLDVRRDFQSRFPFYVKAGLSYTEQYRDKKQPQKRWYWMGADGIATADDFTAAGALLGRFKEPTAVTMGIPGFSLKEPEYFSTAELYKYWQANPQVLRENLAYTLQQQFAGTQKVHETVNAAYVMGNFTFNKLNVLAGVRVESTKDVATSYRVLPTSGGGPEQVTLPVGVNASSVHGILATYRWATSSNKYTSDPFKYLHLKYEVLKNLQARASYTESIGRPNFGDIVPTMTQSDSDVTLDGVLYDGRITSNGADLKPQNSKGLDASLEYYTSTYGVFTASFFRRDVDDYIYTSDARFTAAQLSELNLGAEYGNYLLRRTRNIGNAKWTGFELGLRQQFRGMRFLPKAVQGFEVWANYTKNLDMKGNFGTLGSNITSLANVVPQMYNGGISYRTPRGKLYVSLTTNYQAARQTDSLPAFDANGQRDRKQETYQFWNMEINYKFSEKIRLTCKALNITGERPEISQIRGIIVNKQQDTGIAWSLMTKIDL